MRISLKTYFLLFLILLFTILISLPFFFSPLTGLHDFRQTQTAGNVWLYYKYGFDVLKYHVPMFGGRFWMLEFPFYQIIVYFLTRLLGFHDYVGRLVSIILFVISLGSFFYICLRIFGKARNAVLTTFLYSIIPINIYYYRAFIPDPFVVTISLFIIALSLSLGHKFSLKKLVLIYILFLIGALSKITGVSTVIFPVIFLLYNAVRKHQNKLQIILVSAASLILITGFFIFWHRYTQAMNATSFTLIDGTLKDWYLGTRYFSLDYYLLLVKRLYQELSFPGAILTLLGAIFLLKEKKYHTKIILFWILNIIVYIFIFNNLNFIHNYYQLPIMPLIAIVLEFGLIYLMKKIANARIYKTLLYSFFLFYILYSSRVYSAQYTPNAGYTERVLGITDVIRNCTKDNDKIVYIWPYAEINHPTILYYAKRIGYNHDLFNLSSVKKILDFDKEVRNLVIFPVDKNYKSYIILLLENNKINVSEKCFQNDTLVLDIN